MTNQATCLDGFAISKNNTRKLIEGRVRRISKHFSNCLPIAKKPKKSETASSRFSTVLLGYVGAGKSSLVSRFLKGQFVKFQTFTSGDICNMVIQLTEESYKPKELYDDQHEKVIELKLCCSVSCPLAFFCTFVSHYFKKYEEQIQIIHIIPRNSRTRHNFFPLFCRSFCSFLLFHAPLKFGIF